ncbi:hypothetical protein [Streptomyces sp. NPDC059533]|uniref:hypothetical protein n=1 Tax=unclassified Streptomyces TaxID=2593676 RepID=UPI0036B55715
MPFEDELGEALRRAGDGFTADRHALVEAGERRGRRLVARRRAAVIGGSVLSLALIGGVGAYAGGLLDGSDRVEVAMPPSPSGGPSDGTPQTPPPPPRGTGAVSGEQVAEMLKGLLPGGTLSVTKASGTDRSSASVLGVYDDGKGKAEISFLLGRVDPAGTMANTQTFCSKQHTQEGEDCTSEQLADGSKLLIQQRLMVPSSGAGEGAKQWRASLVTPQGYLVQLIESNAQFGITPGSAPDGFVREISRTDPPLSPAGLKALVTSDKWHPALEDLPAAAQEGSGWSPARANALRDLKAVDQLQNMVVKRLKFPVVSQGGEGGSGYLVVDDGKGKSLIRLDVVKATGTPDFEGDVTRLLDGTQVKVTQAPAEKGVVRWTVDSLYKNGLRVTATTYNAADQSGPATREAPALTLEQLRYVASDPKWSELDYFASE